jgi:hypothetical protein
MDVIQAHCAGLDVHKKTVVASIIVSDERGKLHQETRTFETMIGSLLALSDWLLRHRVTHIAMESTGEYWKPIFNINVLALLVRISLRPCPLIPERASALPSRWGPLDAGCRLRGRTAFQSANEYGVDCF